MSFHPCVRYRRWESERVLSFIPPDGNFRLMSYHIGAQNIVSIPIFVRHLISFKESGGGKIEIRVGPKQTNGRTVSRFSYFDGYFSYPILILYYVNFILARWCCLGDSDAKDSVECKPYTESRKILV